MLGTNLPPSLTVLPLFFFLPFKFYNEAGNNDNVGRFACTCFWSLNFKQKQTEIFHKTAGDLDK